jgi:hypothetical protein
MSSRFVHHYIALGLLGGMVLLSPAARAEYKCDAPQSSLDARACEAARQGPTQLRQFIQRVRSIESLYFYDYVNEAQAVAWREQEERAALLKKVPTHGTLATAAPR